MLRFKEREQTVRDYYEDRELVECDMDMERKEKEKG